MISGQDYQDFDVGEVFEVNCEEIDELDPDKIHWHDEDDVNVAFPEFKEGDHDQ